MKANHTLKMPLRIILRLAVSAVLVIALVAIFFFISRSPSETYSGETLDGLPHGFGTWKHPGGSYYAGQFFEGERHGRGTWIHPDGIKYAGDWQYGEYHGRGSLILPGGAAYHGEWSGGKKDGRGIYIWPGDIIYKGYWEKDRQQGYGTLHNPGGINYEGQWHDGQKQGEGRAFYPDGSQYYGQWLKDRRHGTGTMIFADGSIYEGAWYDDKQHGEGTVIYPDGSEKTAIWVNGRLQQVAAESISLDPEQLTLVAGGTGASIRAEILPDEATETAISWASSNSSVATVDSEGYVRPVSTGSATITATTAGSNLTAICTITVTSTSVAVSGVSLDRTSITIRVGETATLAATVRPAGATNPSVTWSSSDSEVAAVYQETGRRAGIRAFAPGEVFVTVRTVDGSYSSRCQVTVLPKEDPANRVEVPRLIGKMVDEARSVITEAGLGVGDIRSEYHPTAPEYQVISQNPAVGASVNRGSLVNLVLSRGPEPAPEPEPGPEPDPEPEPPTGGDEE
jgi:hypothetical protein